MLVMTAEKLNDIPKVNSKLGLELKGIPILDNIKLRKVFEDNRDLFQKDRGEFIDFINTLKDYNLKKGTVLGDEAVHLLFKLDLDSYSIVSFFEIIGLDDNQKKSLLEKFKFENSIFNDFIKEKRIIPKKDEKLIDLLVSQMSIKIESAFQKMLDEKIKNTEGLESLTEDNINKILVPDLLEQINKVIKDEVKLTLNEQTATYLPLPSDSVSIRNLKTNFYSRLVSSLSFKLTSRLTKSFDDRLNYVFNNESYEWERKIYLFNQRKKVKSYLKKSLKSKVIKPSIDSLKTECEEYLKDNFRTENKKTGSFARHLILLDKPKEKLDKKLDSSKEKLEQAFTQQFRSKFDDRLIEQASISLSAEKFLPFFISLECDMRNYLKEKLPADTFNEIHCFKDMMNFFDFKEENLQLFIEERGGNTESTLLFNNYFLSPENQEVMNANKDQSESKCKLRLNDADLGVSDLSSTQERRLSKSSLYSIPLKVASHGTLSFDMPLEKKKNKGKGKLSKWTCGLFCGHKKTKFDQDEAYSPVRSESYVPR